MDLHAVEDALARYLDDGRIELDNMVAERCARSRSATATTCSPLPMAVADGQPPSKV
jgi:hypothetical protein